MNSEDDTCHKVLTLREGAWFGDYQIMLNTMSDWDLVAGYDSESNLKTSRPLAMPANNIMVYELDSDKLKKFLDEYPDFRSFVITRSMARRAYLAKIKKETE